MASLRSEGGDGDGDGRRRQRNKKLEPRLSRRASGSSIAGAGSGSAALSSASGGAAGGRRRSFGSDIDEMFSHLSTRLAAHESSGPDPDRKGTTDTLTPHSNKNHPPKSAAFTEAEKAKEEVPEEEALDPACQSFSIAVRECQNRRFRSVATSSPVKKLTHRRPASLDLNGPLGVDVAVQSPRFLMGGLRGTQKTSASATSSRSRSGVFPSPGTPGYRNGGSMAYQKGWSSERVPLPANFNRRYVGGGGSALLSGRTLPSKWDDAEKWICSPVSGDGSRRPSVPPPHHRRPKSKSGPLGPPASPYSAASPLIPCFDNGRIGNFAAESPFMAGVLVPDRGCLGSYSSAGSGGGGGGSIGSITEGGRRSYSANAEPYIARSASIHGWSELIECPSLPSSQGTIQDDKLESCREAGIMISPVVLRKDVATQMSPERSFPSSPKESPSPSAQPIEELESHFSKPEVRDVQVDDQGTVTRWSKKLVIRAPDKKSIKIIECRKKTDEAKESAWGVAEPAKIVSMCNREEAKITAWENLQKAKAEAEIQKLEMKLEKKRSSSMDKILNKLRYAQRKAQEMRSAATTGEVPEVSPSQTHEVDRTTKKLPYFRRTAQMSSFSSCFTCPVF